MICKIYMIYTRYDLHGLGYVGRWEPYDAHWDGFRPNAFISHGKHASYPVSGKGERLRKHWADQSDQIPVCCKI